MKPVNELRSLQVRIGKLRTKVRGTTNIAEKLKLMQDVQKLEHRKQCLMIS